MRALALIGLAACGRINFDPLGGAGTADATNVGNANVAFVSRSTTSGAVGGLQGADSLCMTEAAAAGLSGNFVAWLSTSNVNAIDRLAGARGWVRPDGQPIVDQAGDLLAGVMFNPIDLDASSQRVAAITWTGTDSTGGLSAVGACGDWSQTSGTGTTGNNAYSTRFFTDVGGVSCSEQHNLYCFQNDRSAIVTPQPASGRLAFVSATGRSSPGLAALDAICDSDAQAAMLPGTYLAAVATATSSIVARFTIDSRPWVRIDGTQITAGGTAFFDPTTTGRSFVNQTPDGTYVSSAAFFTGAVNPSVQGTVLSTCSDWTSLNSGATGNVGSGISSNSGFWANGSSSCNSPLRLLCLQE